MAELSRRTRILLAVGLAGAAGALTLGGVAYAVGGSGDSSGDSAYVQLDGSNATTQDTQPDTSPDTTPDNGTEGTQPGDRDCPEKDGSGGGSGGQDGTETPAQPETPDNSSAADRA
jgi:hypothetical protein